MIFPDTKQKPSKNATAYQKKKEAEAKRMAIKSAEGRNFNFIPEPARPEVVERCRRSLADFCLEYFPDMFDLKFSPDHMRAIQKIENCVLRGALLAMALPRGSGKTTLCQVACLWASLYGHRRFVLFVAASQEKSLNLLDEIKVWAETNKVLQEDFPRALYPIQKLERIAQRAKGQTYQGIPTRITWTGDTISWPMVEKSDCPGYAIQAAGMNGSAIRGAKFSTDQGVSIRPDLVLIDDFQTRESAASPTQCRKIIKILNADVLKCAGPGRSISAMAACTIIEPDDAAEQLVTAVISPKWQGERVAMIKQWPDNMELWDQYAEKRKEEFIEGGDGSEAREFYRKNQKAMSAGAVVYWEDRKLPEEIDALEHAMNLWADDKRSFMSEMQNQPEHDDGIIERITAADFQAKITGFAEFSAPEDATQAVAFVDVQGDLLFWAIVTANHKMTGLVSAFGSWPEQREKYFTNENARRKLSDMYGGKSFEAYMRLGLNDVRDHLHSLKLTTKLGEPITLSAIGFDANWGESTDIVYDFCANHAECWPMHGRYVGATSKPFKDRKKKRGDILRDGYHIPRDKGNHPCRHVAFDTNAKKSFVLQRFLAAEGEEGAWYIHGNPKKTKQEMFIDHMTSEYGIDVTAKGRTVREYKARPNDQNHWFDCVVGCAVLLSMQGCALPDHKAGKPVKPLEQKKRVSFAELQKQKK